MFWFTPIQNQSTERTEGVRNNIINVILKSSCKRLDNNGYIVYRQRFKTVCLNFYQKHPSEYDIGFYDIII